MILHEGDIIPDRAECVMRLQYCSITGADNDVDPDDLFALGRKYPFVEWAILLLPSQAGMPRCPDMGWIENFVRVCQGNRAMHLCEGGLLGFIAGDSNIRKVMSGFQRIQLNVKFGDVEGRYDPAELVARVREAPQWQFIIQYAADKKNLLQSFENIKNHAVLFDASAGKGISPASWDAPLPGHFCGYAGGINPDNVARNLEMILKTAAGHTTWIDMESGVRTNDRFDLDKIHRVLEISAPYANSDGTTSTITGR